jgi:hypothetical protein
MKCQNWIDRNDYNCLLDKVRRIIYKKLRLILEGIYLSSNTPFSEVNLGRNTSIEFRTFGMIRESDHQGLIQADRIRRGKTLPDLCQR